MVRPDLEALYGSKKEAGGEEGDFESAQPRKRRKKEKKKKKKEERREKGGGGVFVVDEDEEWRLRKAAAAAAAREDEERVAERGSAGAVRRDAMRREDGSGWKEVKPRCGGDGSDSDASPPRRRARLDPESDSDASPPRRPRVDPASDSDASPPRRVRAGQSSDSDASPPRKRVRVDPESGSDSEPDEEAAATGLQSGAEFGARSRAEAARRTRALDAMAEAAGAAETVIRDAAGRALTAEEREAALAAAAGGGRAKEPAPEWAAGLAQRREAEQRRAEEARMAAAPVGRSADDAELNRELAAEQRWGDPMLELLRRKRRLKGEPAAPARRGGGRPVYSGGASWPNRYGIRPGYRWDGQDRGNGWEAEYMRRKTERR